ncbi:hypothetical protein INT47_003431 [Mucor saturninus]|uniref:EF-hand domain-containing protein n=1 Tax=Mucor saturninus TaxID=64648 RepID=A0A8H7RGC7_9FUNG|nr:hypothetical protein INT47_003431 [Mucor saturninus]
MKLFVVLFSLMAVVLCELQGEFELQHMHDDHHIEVTDEVTFFKIHDLDGDGFWDEQELKSMYGLERSIDPNAQHIKVIIDRVYKDMDMNKDRYISMDEYITSKLPILTQLDKEREHRWKQEEMDKHVDKSFVNISPGLFRQEGANYVPNKFKA